MNESYRKGGFFRGLIIGAILGVAVYYFFSQTKEGEKIKRKIVKKGKEVLDNLADLINEFEEKSKEFRKQTKKLKQELEERVESLKLGESQKDEEGYLMHIGNLQERGRLITKKFFTRNGKPLTS